MANILRFVIVKSAPEKGAEIERLWKHECSPLMIGRPGCLREELLRCREEAGEYISVSEWISQHAIDAYLNSSECETIKNYTRGASGSAATVKTYDMVGG